MRIFVGFGAHFHFRWTNRSVLLLAAMLPTAARAEPARTQQVPPVTAFVHVNVVPMDRERVLTDQTVLVVGDKIAAIGGDLPIPAGAQIIDGQKEAYLSPGLADMHIHSDTRNDLSVYLANGVTTVLHMGGARSSFVDSVVPAANRGEFPSPHVFTSFLVDGSPDFNGFIIKTPNEARAIVGLAKTNGYDFIKVYVNLSPQVFEALAETGRQQGMPLVGHGVYSVRMDRQLELGQQLIAHAEEFFYSFFTPPGAKESDMPPAVDRIPEAVAVAKRHGGTVVADLMTYHHIQAQIGHPEFVDAALARSEASVLSPSDRLGWLRSGYPKKTAKLAAKFAFLQRLVKALSDGGVALVSGTDAATIPGIFPGYSLHDNLSELEKAGLSRYQALSTATRQPGEFIAKTKGGTPFGTVAVGSQADLVLTHGNPLEALATLRDPAGVMADGRWYDVAALDKLLDDVRTAYQAAESDRQAMKPTTRAEKSN